MVERCTWCGEDELYTQYHDEEWGVPCYNDRTLFEFLLLEGAQAGLAWITVLRKRQGYRKIDRDGLRVLLWKPFTKDVDAPKWIRRQKKPEPIPGKVTVTAFLHGWCPGQNIVFERAKRAAASFDDRVVFREVNTFDRQVLLEWGIADALFIDDKEVSTGPPPSYDHIHKLIAKRLRKL